MITGDFEPAVVVLPEGKPQTVASQPNLPSQLASSLLL